MDICTECGKQFEADDTNSVNIKILGLYGICCKECAIKLKKEGKIQIIKQGSIPL